MNKLRALKKDLLTKTEAGVIRSLIQKNKEEGWYYSRKEQYFKRLDRILEKLDKLTVQKKTISR